MKKEMIPVTGRKRTRYQNTRSGLFDESRKKQRPKIQRLDWLIMRGANEVVHLEGIII